MTTNKEVTGVLKRELKGIVSERILLRTLDDVGDWTGEIMGMLTTLSGTEDRKTEETFDRIHTALLDETIKQLQAFKIKKINK